ncbi:cell wall-active antibiotics response protein LiaF [Bacillus sp. 31A1R]|uniref:Cell wall-active antibiotics response protein LiaF n=1 Tax=Robertmurraya mangrovi TaxID=3098077 RepID=A0ABU5ISU5_9BACI|nr:cell wall-active antibiotics response protein LiaF [Bacillus sp. 31A1R]MDZ5470218.1 cell wall-active antibiotics response protein LiaF [Bacillus sp. 31A1R]
MRYQTINQVLFAGLLLTVGIVLLLVNIGVISLEIKDLFVGFYPFVLLVLGIVGLINSLRKREGVFASLFLVIFAGLLVLDRLAIISFGFWDVWKLWPYIIIYLGLSMLFKKRTIKVHFEKDLPLDTYNEETYKDVNRKISKKGFSIGDVNLKKANWSLEPMEIYNTIGDYFIDFSKAYIPERETKVKLNGWIGDVKMIVPEDIPVMIQSRIKVGDIRIFDNQSEAINRTLFFKSKGYDEATRKLNITVELKIGSIRIDKV